MASHVSAIAAAAPSEAAAHFARKLSLETDCWDVHESLKKGPVDFVLLDVRGRQAFARGHVPGALSLPHAEITAERMMSWPHATLFVVYCAGPHCNGADRAALRPCTREDDHGQQPRQCHRRGSAFGGGCPLRPQALA